MVLSKRLQCVADKVKKGSKVADIGTDHAYIPIYLIANNICEYAIASDIKKGPINIAKANIMKHTMEKSIETRLGKGLCTIKQNEVDTVIIAGMGGELIREILKDSKEVCETIDTFILQPMTAGEELREWLYNNRYRIDDETLIKEDEKFYNIIVCSKGYDKVDKIYYDIGIKLIENNDPLLGQYLDKKINETMKIMQNLEGKETSGARVRLEECNNKLKQYLDLKIICRGNPCGYHKI